MRFRDIFLGLGSLLVLALLFLTDPAANVIGQLPIGASTINVLINLVISLLYVGLLHCSRKALVDYLDLEGFFRKAFETSQGAGLALVAVALIMISISLVVLAAAYK